ncbi:replicative DNA helicase [Crenobacter intestini]|uniref:SF4 helicase domain-containing protein n=1 Tax=Crenobacter intestini TaxID=2563443 RepID=A0A4T0UIT5_9NEIS|nr:DnaB-like helicase C-terminal domain-containing protein [Crenobacter intestini]TIC78420.1 hypothetical protein E5K04_16385 [Crenobacter intestini]
MRQTLDRESLIARERNLIGSLLLNFDGAPLPEDAASLKPEWICNEPLHVPIARALWWLAAAGRPRDALSVIEHVKRHEQLHPDDDVEKYLFGLFQSHTAFPSELQSTCRLLADEGKRRDMRTALMQAINEMGEHESYEQALAAALARIDGKANEGMNVGLLTAEDIAHRGLDFIDRAIGGLAMGMPTGFGSLDALLYGGLHSGELVTIAGAAGGGKTTAVTSILENLVSDGERVVLVVSREMGEEQIAVRHFASLGGGRVRNMMTGDMQQSDYDAVAAAVGRLSGMKLIYDLDSNTPAQVALKAAQVKRKYGRLDAIVVDHIGLMRSNQQHQRRHEAIADITWSLKTMARQMDTTVIAVAQCKRPDSTRADAVPKLTDMAESASIERDSDTVIGVLAHRDGDLKGYTEIHVLKARMGEIGMAVAKFRHSRIAEADLAEFEAARSMAASSLAVSKTERRGIR